MSQLIAQLKQPISNHSPWLRRLSLAGLLFFFTKGLLWIALGYCLFLLSSLDMIGVWEESPDMFVAAFVYLASGILLRMRNGGTSYLTYAFLGMTLGFAYLSKAVMFPLSFIFLSLSLFPIGNLRKALPRTIIAFIIFAGLFYFFLQAIQSLDPLGMHSLRMSESYVNEGRCQFFS